MGKVTDKDRLDAIGRHLEDLDVLGDAIKVPFKDQKAAMIKLASMLLEHYADDIELVPKSAIGMVKDTLNIAIERSKDQVAEITQLKAEILDNKDNYKRGYTEAKDLVRSWQSLGKLQEFLTRWFSQED